MDDYEGVLNFTPIHRDNSIPGDEWEMTGARSDFTAAKYFKAIYNVPATEKKVNAFLQMVKEVNKKLFVTMDCINRISMVVESDVRITELLSQTHPSPVTQESDEVMFR
ncbi:MAG: hypothetical protein LHW59_09795 [Candidatus Cloacimonetes bacterium]|nr:hypothetical protein [Candidatus Cloacimonadota bacterium]